MDEPRQLSLPSHSDFHVQKHEFYQQLRVALCEGIEFAKNHIVPFPLDNIERRIDLATETYRVQPQGLQHLCHALFLFGASKAVEYTEGLPRESMILGHNWGAQSQHELIRGLLFLNRSNIRQTLSGWNHVRVGSDEWRKWTSGGWAAALTVRELLLAGVQVYLPTLEEDIGKKIDLIALYPDGKHGLCVQVKSTKSFASRVDGVEKSNPGGHTQHYYDRFIRGVSSFDAHHHGSWKPVMIQVGVNARYRSLDGGYNDLAGHVHMFIQSSH